MIATARGLVVLAAIAAVLLVLVIVVGPRRPAAVDRALLPGFDDSKISELVFTRDGQSVRVSRGGANQWRVQDPPALAEPATIDAVLTALRGGRWHRRGNQRTVGPSHAQLTIGTTTLSIHDALPGTEQTWIVRGGEALLVDSWVASSLAPEPLALRVRHPIDCASAKAIASTIDGGLKIVGTRVEEPHKMWIDRTWLDRLYNACARIEIVALRTGPLADQPSTFEVLATGDLAVVGKCDKTRMYIESSSGAGCVDSGAVSTLAEALREIRARPDLSFDRRALPIDPITMRFGDGPVLDLTGRPRLGDADADPERVRELLAVFATRMSSTQRPYRAPDTTIVAVDRAGVEVTLQLWSHAIAREGEVGALEIPDEQWALLERLPNALLDATRWREDAANISSLELDDVRYTRGAVLGEWTRSPAGKLDPKLVEALAEAVATLRAPAGPPPRVRAHRLRVTFSPPVGQPVMHTIDFDPPTAEGCAARVDNVASTLPLPACIAAQALH